MSGQSNYHLSWDVGGTETEAHMNFKRIAFGGDEDRKEGDFLSMKLLSDLL